MKRIISILAILIFFATSYGQDPQPTKQETMDWIAGKFQNNNINKYQVINNGADEPWFESLYFFVSYEKNIITICDKTHFLGTNRIILKIQKINLNEINNVTFINNFAIILNGKNILQEKSGDDESISENTFYILFPDEKHNGIIDFSSEPNLFDRMVKALSLLAKYNNSEKPNEKF
jgi:hypothetical protein